MPVDRDHTSSAVVIRGRHPRYISTFCARLGCRLPTHNDAEKHRLRSVANVREAGFGLLATFGRPHYTLTLPDTSESTLSTLAAALGPETANPYHVTRRRR